MKKSNVSTKSSPLAENKAENIDQPVDDNK